MSKLEIPLIKLPCLASRTTPLLPLDDIYVTGALRERLEEPKVGLRLINSFRMGTAFFEWIVHCPFLGVAYYSVLQDVAYQRYYSYTTLILEGYHGGVRKFQFSLKIQIMGRKVYVR